MVTFVLYAFLGRAERHERYHQLKIRNECAFYSAGPVISSSLLLHLNDQQSRQLLISAGASRIQHAGLSIESSSYVPFRRPSS